MYPEMRYLQETRVRENDLPVKRSFCFPDFLYSLARAHADILEMLYTTCLWNRTCVGHESMTYDRHCTGCVA
jgi:hypothetical protein